MSLFTSSTHPTFEALSAHADLGEMNAARTRVGRHVAACSECREVLAEIRALGAAARAMPVEDPSPALWSRIEAASAAAPLGRTDSAGALADLPALHSRAGVSSPDTRSRRWARAPMLLWSVALAAAAAVAAIVVLPNRSSLEATATSRLSFSPSRPVPGGSLHVRYRAAPWLAGAPRLILAGRYASLVSSRQPAEWRGDLDAFADSLATLLPTADGSYEATVRLPRDFLAVHIFVTDSMGEMRDADGPSAWTVIGGTSRGAPSLDALLAAQDRNALILGSGRSAPRTQAVSVADSIQRYFPGHPAGWAFYEKYGVRSGILDLLRFFETAERKYASLDEKLWPATRLDAERLHDMAVLARRIDEPAETRKWVLRLVREHPDDPRALGDLAESLHDMEMRETPQLADSMRRWMPVLDSLWRRGGARRPPTRAIDLVRTYGDSAMIARWPTRSGFPRVFGYPLRVDQSLDTSASSDSVARAIASSSCDRPAGKVVLTLPISTWRYMCSMRKSATWAHLSAVALAQGRAHESLALADSALELRGSFCNANSATRAHAYALLATGDTAAAAREFAIAFGQLPRPTESPDSLAAVLDRHLPRAAFDSIASATHASVAACDRARIAQNLARQRRERR